MRAWSRRASRRSGCSGAGGWPRDRNGVEHDVDLGFGARSASAGARRHRERRVAAIAVSTQDQSQPWVRTKQAYPSVSVLLLAAGGKVRAVIAIERSDIMVGVGTIENGALAVRQ
jgi:hypothetical protein